MNKLSIESRLVSSESSDERLAFIMETFGDDALYNVLNGNPLPEDELGSIWREPLSNLLSCISPLFVSERIAGRIKPGATFAYFSSLDDLRKAAGRKGVSATTKKKLDKYIDELPKIKGKKDKPKAEQASHTHVMLMLDLLLARIKRKIHDVEHKKHAKEALKQGDVIAEGPGFEVFISDSFKNLIRYPEGNTAIILIHDAKDGHFLILERYCEIDQGFILELPKIPASGHDQEAAASNFLQDSMGMTLRELEKIGEIRPDTHMIQGACDVYYANFHQEENFTAPAKDIRAIKRITEEGIYQCAFDGRITCAATLSSMAIWRAFESVRKKRIANSRRVRTPKAADEEEDE